MKNFITALLLFPLVTAAQNFHFAGRLGLSGYNGDLKEKAVSLSQSKLMGSLGVQYDLSEHITARTYITFAQVKADDKKGSASMEMRNLNFASKIWDGELSVQYSLLNLNDHWWTPYVFAGVGLYNFNPYTKDTAGNKYFLQPLSTEGEGFATGVANYKLTQFSVPVGVGAAYAINEDTRLGLEFGYRKIFTDHLDDVSGVYVDQSTLLTESGPKAVELAYRGGEVNAGPYPAAGIQRGNPEYKDGYYYVALTLTVRYFFDKYKKIAGIPGGKRDKRVGCPANRR